MKRIAYVSKIAVKNAKAGKSTLRKTLIQRQKKCAISKYSNPLEIQVAHIIPRHMNKHISYNTNTELNCWLLGNGLHTLFDNFHWTVDIFSFLDFKVESESEFKSFLVVKDLPREGSSQLNLYVDKVFHIPVRYFPSLYAHYYTYLMKNFRGENPHQSWNSIVKSDVFRELCNMETTSEMRGFLLQQRNSHFKEQKEVKKGDCTIVINHNNSNDTVNIVWDYYKFLDNTWEPSTNVSDDLLSKYLDFKERIEDPDWTPK